MIAAKSGGGAPGLDASGVLFTLTGGVASPRADDDDDSEKEGSCCCD
jgi:hypothetical protein